MKPEISYLKAAAIGALLSLAVQGFNVFAQGHPIETAPYYAGSAMGGALLACGVAWMVNRKRRA